jgi:hypothetical protein
MKMPLHVEWSRQSALMRRIEAVQAAGRPGSKAMNRAQKDIRDIIYQDHVDKMLSGQTKDGGQRAPLATSTLADPERGPGPSLIPHGMSSRWITLYEVVWLPAQGGANATVLVLVARWRDEGFRTKTGESIFAIHEKGDPGRNLPARPTAGIRPVAFTKIDAVIHRLGIDVLKGA